MVSFDGPNRFERPVAEENRTLHVSNKENGTPLREFYRLVESELGYLRTIARRWCKEPANVEDLVHDTVVQALANAHQWEFGSCLRAWLFTIMRNQFFANTARSRRAVQALDSIATAEPGRTSNESQARLVIRDVQRALSRLPATQRMAIEMIGVSGKSYDETALMMGMSVAAVRCHLARGRERLRTLVGDREVYRRTCRGVEAAAHTVTRTLVTAT